MYRNSPAYIQAQRVRTKRHYENNKEAYIERSAARKKVGRELIISLKQKPCLDCSIEYPHYVMQFDHSRGEKLFNLAQGHYHGEQQIRDEVAKCDIVCANCHAIRTWNR